jgi:hypothetical protein
MPPFLLQPITSQKLDIAEYITDIPASTEENHANNEIVRRSMKHSLYCQPFPRPLSSSVCYFLELIPVDSTAEGTINQDSIVTANTGDLASGIDIPDINSISIREDQCWAG